MPANVKLLLVDDNPMVLGMLRGGLAQIAQVTTAADAADALLQAIEAPPDLLVADYDMDGMNGRQLLEKLRSRPNTSRVPVILMATKADMAEKLKPVQDMVEDFVEKPFFLKEAVARVKRVVDKISLEKMAKEAPAGGDGKLRGTLAQMNVIDLLQSLDLGHKSCLLVLTNEGDRCDIYFADGQINHATYGPLKGDEAVYKVLAWTGGNFEIDFNVSSSEQTTSRSTQGLLMEGLRLLDESAREGDEENVLEA
ncbi:MAG TPA: response regulator [Terriglobales bacterium]|nr:response regulator [Terriglobales bacterium]